MEALKQGAMNLAGLRSSLPPDERTVPVRNASLSRSLRRLAERGLVECANHFYFRPDTPETVKVRAANSIDAMREKALAVLRGRGKCF